MEKQSIIRIFILILFSAIAVYFIYFLNIESNTVILEIRFKSATNLDSIISQVLEKYNISKENIKLKKIKFDHTEFVRDEISVNLPDIITKDNLYAVKTDTLILLIHYDLKQQLLKYNYKISGVENTTENTTTLFIQDENKIIKAIIFKIQTRKERSYNYQLKDKRK